MITKEQENLFKSTLGNEDRYRSFCGTFTIDEAIKYLGADHVEWLISQEGYHLEIKRRVLGAWHANNGAAHKAYCAIMQAGQARTERLLNHRTEANQAFDKALASGRLSEDKNAPNYIGHYMYMGNTRRDYGKSEDRDLFKHYMTRQYID